MVDYSADNVLNVANSYKNKFIETGDFQYLESTISIIAQGCSHPHFIDLCFQERSRLLMRLGYEQLEKYYKSGDLEDLDLGFVSFQDAIKQITLNNKEGQNFAVDLLTLIWSDEPARNNHLVIQRTIGMYEDILTHLNVESEERLRTLINLANANKRLYELNSRQADLEKAIKIHEELLVEIPNDSKIKPVSLNNFGNALLQRYKTLVLQRNVS